MNFAYMSREGTLKIVRTIIVVFSKNCMCVFGDEFGHRLALEMRLSVSISFISYYFGKVLLRNSSVNYLSAHA